MRYSIFLILLIFFLQSCKKENISIGTNVSETFYVENKGASMRVLVEGNTTSKVLLLFVHGGPGSSSYFYNTDYITQHLEDKYAVAYWDHRNAGASQGNSNAANFNLTVMTEDLEKVIQVLKHRYGNDVSVFLLAHSFGGMLTTSFVTKGDNQYLIKGWIYCSASHNYPLNDDFTRIALTNFANQEIALGNHTNEWQEILDYCNSLPSGILSLEQANKLNSYATDAETYFDHVTPFPMMDLIKANAIKQNYAITSTFLNLKYSQGAAIQEELREYNFTEKLNNVTIPILTLYGKYDFICPPALGVDITNNVSSLNTFSFTLPNSGHIGMYQDQELFVEKVNGFIEQFK
jgi:pimeloyl-ACP methyl ester carboxylesterase